MPSKKLRKRRKNPRKKGRCQRFGKKGHSAKTCKTCSRSAKKKKKSPAKKKAKKKKAKKKLKYKSAVIKKTEGGTIIWERRVSMKLGSFYLSKIGSKNYKKGHAIFRWVCNTYGNPCPCGTEEDTKITIRTWVCECGCGATASISSSEDYKRENHLRKVEKLAEIHKQMYRDVGVGSFENRRRRNPRNRAWWAEEICCGDYRHNPEGNMMQKVYEAAEDFHNEKTGRNLLRYFIEAENVGIPLMMIWTDEVLSALPPVRIVDVRLAEDIPGSTFKPGTVWFKTFSTASRLWYDIEGRIKNKVRIILG